MANERIRPADGRLPAVGYKDVILLWRLPEQMNPPRRVGEPYGRCYIRLQWLGKQWRVFFSKVQEEAPPLEPHLLWLAGYMARLFSLDVFGTRWFLHTPAGLHGLSMDAYAEMVFDWTAGPSGPVVSRLSWHEVWLGQPRPIELPASTRATRSLSGLTA